MADPKRHAYLLWLAGALCGVEMGLARAGVPIARAGVSAALSYLESAA
jgi:hypothetical protein